MDLLKGKTGMTASFIIGMMITLIAFVLISGVLLRFMSKSSDIEAEVLCQNSIALRAKSAFYVKSSLADAELKLVPPLCKTIDKKITGNRQQILRQIAEASARCWWMFNEGRYEEILSSGDLDILPSVLGFDGYENQCFNCYTLLIDQEEIEGGSITAKELFDFFPTKKYSKVNMTYLDYIQGYGGPGRVVLTAPEIFPRAAYTVSMMPKNKEGDTYWKGVLQLSAGAAMISPLGIFLVPAILTGIDSYAQMTGNKAKAGELPGNQNIAGQAPLVPIIAAGTGAAGAYLGVAGFMNLMGDMYAERDVSSIYVGFLEVGQEKCGSGDIAGE
ncbi:MAG: hypothetical protein AABW48_05590 [Nanoarchaeota archaeon]